MTHYRIIETVEIEVDANSGREALDIYLARIALPAGEPITGVSVTERKVYNDETGALVEAGDW